MSWITDCALWEGLVAPVVVIDYGWKNNSGVNATTVNFSSGVTGRTPIAGDVAVVFVQVQNAITSPTAGWTQIDVGNSAFDVSAVYAKTLDGSETSFSIGSNSGTNMFMFMCFDGSGWESPIAEADGVSVNTYTPGTMTATGSNSLFVQLVTVTGNINLTDLTYTGAWDEVVIAVNGTTISPAFGLVVAVGGPGSSPAITWDPVGTNRDFRVGGVVIIPS